MSPRPHVPEPVLAAAHARSRARREKDWDEADRLKAEIEAAGWRVVDRGTDFRLQPTAPPDVERDGVILYGASGNVPSRLGDEPTTRVSVVLIARDPPTVQALADEIGSGGAADRDLVVVAADPDEAMGDVLAGFEGRADRPDVVRTTSDLTIGAACNAGMRRARGRLVVLATAAIPRIAESTDALATALDDPSIAAAGIQGTRTADLRTFEPVDRDPDVLDLHGLAFRRADGLRLGPLDERFQTERALGAWWSLVLRLGARPGTANERDAAGESSGTGRATSVVRRIVIVPGWGSFPKVPAAPVGAAAGSQDAGSASELGRPARRDYYRLRGSLAGEVDRLSSDGA